MIAATVIFVSLSVVFSHADRWHVGSVEEAPVSRSDKRLFNACLVAMWLLIAVL